MTAIGVLFGGPSPEHDVSILTGLQAARVLTQAGQAPEAVYWTKTGDFFAVDAALEGPAFAHGVPAKARPLTLSTGERGFAELRSMGRTKRLDVDVFVNCCHGGAGEDGRLQGMLDLAGVTYTGPSAAGAALGMDKLAFGGVVGGAGLPTLPRAALTAAGRTWDFDGPWILKPRFGGSSIGIEVVHDIETALALLATSPHLKSGAVVEPFRPASYDVNVAVRLVGDPQLSAFERPARAAGADGSGIYSYEQKYLGGRGMESAKRELPAVLDTGRQQRLTETARRIAELSLVRGAARIDFLVDGDQFWVNEINTIPGSLGLYLWRAAGVSNADVILGMVEEAKRVPTYVPVTSGADGRALASAGAIASKLG